MSLITLAEAKAILQISNSAQDALLQILIDSAESFVQSHCGILLEQASFTEYLTATGNRYNLWPTGGPITAVTEILDTEDSDAAVDLTTIRAKETYIGLEDGGKWGEGRNRYKTTCTIGYTDASRPAGLKELVLQLIYRKYNARGGKDRQAAAGHGFSFAKLMESDLGEELALYSLRTQIG